MKADRWIGALVIGFSLAVTGAWGCASSGSGSTRDDPETAGNTLEVECVQGLEALDRAIERSADSALVAPAALREARALRREAGELYLVSEFQLALELIDEALSLLGGA